MSKKKAIKRVIKNFDFETVNNVMLHLNWKWAENNEVPNIIQLKKQAKRLLKEASKFKKFSEISTGGFTAYKNEIELGLRFTIIDWIETYKKEEYEG